MVYKIMNSEAVPAWQIRRCTLLVALLCILAGKSEATERHNPPVTASDSAVCNNHHLKLKQFVLPTSLVAAGAIAAESSNLMHHASHSVSKKVRNLQKGVRTMPEDYIQYAPVAASFAIGIAGAKARHPLNERLCITATAYSVMGVVVNAGKLLVDEKRPDSNALNSFPSGHTATAFMGAELTRIEYGGWHGIAAYAVATGVGFMRIYNGRHWLHDVLAGAGLGILSARIGEWSAPMWQHILKKKKTVITPMVETGPQGGYGLSLSVRL